MNIAIFRPWLEHMETAHIKFLRYFIFYYIQSGRSNLITNLLDIASDHCYITPSQKINLRAEFIKEII